MVTESKKDQRKLWRSRQYLGPKGKIHLSLAESVTGNLQRAGVSWSCDISV